MTVSRAAVIYVTAAAFAGCSLFSDLGSYSDEPATPASDGGSNPAEDAANAHGSNGPPDAAPPIDAGPDVSAYKQAVLADKPVAYWPFDEPSGANVAKDIVGGKNAEVVGTIVFGSKGADGTAAERVAADGYLEVGDVFDLAGQQAYSIELWGWPKSAAEFSNVVFKRNEMGKGWIVYFLDGAGSVVIEHGYAAGQRTTSAPLPDPKQRLHHVVFVFDPTAPTDTRQRVYVDTVRTNGFSDDGPADDIATPLRMLESIGVLDEVAIYHHVLTADRIAEHYARAAK